MGLKSERKNNKYKDSRNVDNKAKFKKKIGGRCVCICSGGPNSEF